MIPAYAYAISSEYSRLRLSVCAMWGLREHEYVRKAIRNQLQQMRQARKEALG